MGDSGALFIGFVLGVLTVRTTYLLPGQDFAAGWYAVLVPVIVLALPLYDMIVVSASMLVRESGKSISMKKRIAPDPSMRAASASSSGRVR